MDILHTYTYDGPVLEFDRCIANHWKAATRAVSPAKAKANFKYQYKMQNNKVPRTKIDLPGKVVEVN